MLDLRVHGEGRNAHPLQLPNGSRIVALPGEGAEYPRIFGDAYGSGERINRGELLRQPAADECHSNLL
jgi:hypothetical protein